MQRTASPNDSPISRPSVTEPPTKNRFGMARLARARQTSRMRALIFDLDGTLVDTVYGHVFAWQRAFAEAGLAIDGWRIHRRIGMSGGLFARAAARELGHDIDASAAEDLQ